MRKIIEKTFKFPILKRTGKISLYMDYPDLNVYQFQGKDFFKKIETPISIEKFKEVTGLNLDPAKQKSNKNKVRRRHGYYSQNKIKFSFFLGEYLDPVVNDEFFIHYKMVAIIEYIKTGVGVYDSEWVITSLLCETNSVVD